ncbi:MAG: dethiobiotin synthase [Sphingobacteriaceae bacterium]|nr:dethiobiotin synthase [Sphingobacteriaceae bacterium]
MNLFITGIGTNVGKTVVSAILTEALQADYWKPIQSGIVEGKDSDTVKSFISNAKSVFHLETYLLKEPLSPHFAAKLDGVTIELDKIHLPKTANHLIIEGAGGLLVPINDTQYVIDIAKQLDCEIVLVISSYLGCINHSLLSIDYLKRNNFKIKALVFNGEFETEVKQAIVNYYPNLTIIDIPTLNIVNKSQIKEVSDKIKAQNAL